MRKRRCREKTTVLFTNPKFEEVEVRCVRWDATRRWHRHVGFTPVPLICDPGVRLSWRRVKPSLV